MPPRAVQLDLFDAARLREERTRIFVDASICDALLASYERAQRLRLRSSAHARLGWVTANARCDAALRAWLGQSPEELLELRMRAHLERITPEAERLRVAAYPRSRRQRVRR